MKHTSETTIEQSIKIRDKALTSLLGDFTVNEIDNALKKLQKTSIKTDFINLFKHDDGSINTDLLRAYSDITGKHNIIDSMSPVIDQLASNADDATNTEYLDYLVKTLHDSGYSLEAITNLFNKDAKIAVALTPHPTEHLSPEGIALMEQLLCAAQSPQQEREAATKQAIENIQKCGNFFAEKKANIKDEIDASNHRALIRIKGAVALDRAIEDSIARHYGVCVNIDTNTAPRSWDYDADGKNNADGFAMMAKLSTSTLGMYQHLLSCFENIDYSQLHQDEIYDITQIKVQLEKMVEAITPLYERSREIVDMLADCPDTDDREMLYRKHYPELKDMIGQLDDLYSVVGDGAEQTRGTAFYGNSLKTLNRLRNQTNDPNIDDAFRALKKCGFALEKGQTRHNDHEYIAIINNLFKHEGFLDACEIRGTMREQILEVGDFSKLSQDSQSKIYDIALETIKEKKNRQEIIQYLREANPIGFDSKKNGYIDQICSLIDRIEILSKTRYKFDENVISDASDGAAARQLFLFGLFGVTGKHMPLYEDPLSLSEVVKLIDDFNKNGGRSNAEKRNLKIPKELLGTGSKALYVMFPASDSEKVSGPFARARMFDQIRKVIQFSMDNNVPVHFQLGGGHSHSRHGADVAMLRRIAAQEIRRIVNERGYPLDPGNEDDNQLIRMATTIMYTEQGRSKRIFSATPDQVTHDLASKMNEIIEDRIDIEGIVQPNTYIDEPAQMSDNMSEFTTKAVYRATKKYERFRAVKSGLNDDLIVDRFADKVRMPHLMPYMNNGARPLSKGGNKSAQQSQGQAPKVENPVSDKRAIENDESWYLAQSFHHGLYGSGNFLLEMHEKVNIAHNQKISTDDIHDLVNNPEFAYHTFAHNMVDAARFNAQQLFSRVGAPGNIWTFDRVMKIGKTTYVRGIEGKKKPVLAFNNQNGSVTEEEAYLCKIYYDRALFIALTEAALSPSSKDFGKSIDNIIAAIRPDDNGLEIQPGPKTRAKWPVIDEVLAEHNKNQDHYAMMEAVNDYIDEEIRIGRDKKEIIKNDFGGGDAKQGEKFLRNLCGAYRSGTMPHKAFWSGKFSYGAQNRLKKRLEFSQRQDLTPAPQHTHEREAG